jgi:hypothetical protein
MSAEKSGSKRERRANAKFFPIDTATLSNSLVALSLFWQVISFFSNVGVRLLPSFWNADLIYVQIIVIVIYLWKQNDQAYKRFPVRSYAGNNLAAYGGRPTDGYLGESIALQLPRRSLTEQ